MTMISTKTSQKDDEKVGLRPRHTYVLDSLTQSQVTYPISEVGSANGHLWGVVASPWWFQSHDTPSGLPGGHPGTAATVKPTLSTRLATGAIVGGGTGGGVAALTTASIGTIGEGTGCGGGPEVHTQPLGARAIPAAMSVHVHVVIPPS